MEIGKVEEDVPIPEVNSKVKYPWPEMKVGDSVLIQPDEGQSLYTLKRKIGPSARYYGDTSGKQVKTMLMRGENGIRVWRTPFSRIYPLSRSANFWVMKTIPQLSATFRVFDYDFPPLKVFGRNFQDFPNSHTPTCHEFKHKSGPDISSPENHLIYDFLFQYLPLDGLSMHKKLPEHGIIAGDCGIRSRMSF